MAVNTNRDPNNLEAKRGDTLVKKFILKDKEGEPYPLSGYVIKSQGRLVPDAEETVYDVTIVDGGENDFDDGIVVLRVPYAVTANFPPMFSYDIEATSGTHRITVAFGQITVKPDNTR